MSDGQDETLCEEIDGLTEQRDALLASCRELHEFLAAAMRAMSANGDVFATFIVEVDLLGIPDGVGVLAQAAIAAAVKAMEEGE